MSALSTDRSKRRFPRPSIDPFFSGSTGTPPPLPSEGEEEQTGSDFEDYPSNSRPCDTPSTTRTFFTTNSGDETNDVADTTVIANDTITRIVHLQDEEEVIVSSTLLPSLESEGCNATELEQVPEGYAASQTSSTRATENAGGSQRSFLDDCLPDLKETLVVPIKAMKGDRVVTERHVELSYKDQRECLGCLDSLREIVGNHRRKQREFDVDDGSVVWLCANDKCGSFMCTPCAVHWANRELSRFRPPTCPRCDGYWEIKTLVNHARTCNPKGPDRPIRSPPINRFVDKHGRSDDLMSGMIRFRNIYRKPDGSEYDSAEAYMFWLVVMINESAGFTYHGSDSEKHLFERVWESSYKVYSVDDTDSRLPDESSSEESSSTRSSSRRSEGRSQSLSNRPVSGNYETEASRYASEAMNSANLSWSFAQPPIGNQQQFPVRTMRSEPVMRQRAPLRGLSHQPSFQIGRDVSGFRTVSVNSFSTKMNATPTDATATPTQATLAKASMRICNSGYFTCGKPKSEKPVVSPFLDMLESTLRRVAQEKNFDDNDNPRSSEALYYRRFSGAVEQARHERVMPASEFGQTKSPRDPVRMKTSILRSMVSVPVLAMNKLRASRYFTEASVIPTDGVSAVDGAGASDLRRVSRTLDFDSTMRSADTGGNIRGNTPCRQSGTSRLTVSNSVLVATAETTATGFSNGDDAVHVQRASMPLLPFDAQRNHLRKPSPTGNWRSSLSSSRDFIKGLSTFIIPQDANSDLPASCDPSGTNVACGTADSSRGAPQVTLAPTDCDSISKSEKSDISKLGSNASDHALFGGADSGFPISPGSEISRISYGKMESMANSVDSNQVHSHTHAHLPGVDTRSTVPSLDTASSSTSTSRVSYGTCLSRPDEHSAYLHIRVPALLPRPQGTIPYSHFPRSHNLEDGKGSDGKKLELKGLWRKFIKKK
ncbi:hypothetical protein D1P53_002309 [Cryptococcus gattii VGV]|nr:hypothetical protein D1P53_002309 [Cryptococcus gattii VGV]